MGDFSINPEQRLQDSIKKHYVGVRMQQGVPVLDADWNELEDLRKHEMQSFISNFIGNGVPSNNDGFRIAALDNGGINTIVLQVASSPASISAIEVDLGASTAASVLGFLTNNSRVINYEFAPARITGFHSEPFVLGDGQTLTLNINNDSSETVVFAAADFADIAQASAAEVVAAINASTSLVLASSGSGNDFRIGGGDGSIDDPGRLLVSGSEILNEASVTYSSQPLYLNTDLANKWNVAPLDALAEPDTDDRQDLVYIDVWEREVSSGEDHAIVLPAIGIETSVRYKREWVVRVAPGITSLSGIVPQDGHKYLALGLISRDVASLQAIEEGDIADLRKRQLTMEDLVISPILIKGALGIDKVNSGLFANMMRTTNKIYMDLLNSDYFLATNFTDITAIESVQVLSAFQDIRAFAERISTEAQLKRLENETALDLMRRLYELQTNFLNTLNPLAAATAQRAGTLLLLGQLAVWLDGDGGAIPGLRNSVLLAETPDLGNAYDAQIFINNEIGRRAGILPQGLLELQFVSGPAVSINPGNRYELIYSILSQLNVDETIDLSLTDSLGVFQFEIKDLDEDPNYPGDLSHASVLLAKDENRSVAFDLIVPAGTPAGTQSRIILIARSQSNPDEVDFANVEINVTVGSTLTIPSPQLQLALQFPEINLATDVVSIGRTSGGHHVSFQLAISYLVSSAESDEFQFSVDFIGNDSAFEVLGAATLNPFMLPGSIQADDSVLPAPFTIPVGVVDAAADNLASLMVIRLAKTDLTLPEPFFREIFIHIVTDVAP